MGRNTITLIFRAQMYIVAKDDIGSSGTSLGWANNWTNFENCCFRLSFWIPRITRFPQGFARYINIYTYIAFFSLFPMTRTNDRSIFVKSSTEDMDRGRIRKPVSDGSRGFQIFESVGVCDFCPTVGEFSAFVRRVYRPHGDWLADCGGERWTSGEKCGVLQPWENISTSLGRFYPNHHDHHHPPQPVAPQVRGATRSMTKRPCGVSAVE